MAVEHYQNLLPRQRPEIVFGPDGNIKIRLIQNCVAITISQLNDVAAFQ